MALLFLMVVAVCVEIHYTTLSQREVIMKCLVLALLLWSSAVWATETPVAGKVIFQYVDESDASKYYTVKATNTKHKYFWYIEGERCLATLRGKVITAKCKNTTDAIISQSGSDVLVKHGGEENGYLEGTILYAMYWAIINHDANK